MNSINELKEKLLPVVMKAVDTALNEYKEYHVTNTNQYILARNVIAPLCAKYLKYAVYAKVSPKLNTSGKAASFTATVASLDNPKAAEKWKVLCKVYNSERLLNAVVIDYEQILAGHYNYFATIIEGTCYYLDYSSIIRYQSEMGNACISPKGDYLMVDADYFMNFAPYHYDMTDADKDYYKTEYARLMGKKQVLAR